MISFNMNSTNNLLLVKIDTYSNNPNEDVGKIEYTFTGSEVQYLQ